MIRLRLILIPALLATILSRGEPKRATLETFRQHYNSALAYNDLSLFGACIAELNAAIEYAARNHLEEQHVEATITLAEVMRQTRDYDKGIELLLRLGTSTAYPRLHVRKLGRMAAIYSEWKHAPDLILQYLDSALKLAGSLQLKAEEAGLYNELGYTLSANNRQLGLQYLMKSARLYASLKDTHSYISPMNNMLRIYLQMKDSARAQAVISELLPLLKDKPWYTSQVELYRLIASNRMLFYKDSTGMAYWNSMADKSMIRNLEAINSTQVNNFRLLHGTRELREQMGNMESTALQKQQELDRQTRRSHELIIFLSLMGLLMTVVIALLWREKHLRKRLRISNTDLQISNERYRMLMVESNHRIKNNLQMVISMMQYNEEEQRPEIKDAFGRMSGKVHTISTLHKYLSAGTHNERVAMDTYFNGIVSLYNNIAEKGAAIRSNIAAVKIESERLVYFGLILNEMIANTIEHGKGLQQKASITVQPVAEGYCFEYCDESSYSPLLQEGMGRSLIRQLIQRIGGTEFSFDASTGRYQFVFHE